MRYPLRNLLSNPFDVEWDEAYKQAMIPEDGTILVRREWVEKKYRVKHDDDGTIRYIPLIEKIEEE
jgi:hypothetical protein|tara:strand:+ start:1454 stop:1651 length:198 start_codon:yes stop_codon:yes gene_type:complete